MRSPGEPAIIVGQDAAAAADGVAFLVADALASAAAGRGRADFATTGGSTPAAVYRALLASPLRDRVPWGVLNVWLGDDRFVPRGDPDSNLGPVDGVLLAGDPGRGLAPAPLDPGRVHPWPVDAALAEGHGPAWAAARHEQILRAELTVDPAGRPVFDAVMVGIGPDGHLLSIFPGSAAFEAPGWTTWSPAPTHIEPRVARVTLTLPALDASPALVVAAFGSGKSAVLAELLGSGHADPSQRASDEHALPALRARRTGATWVLDQLSASGIPTDDVRIVPRPGATGGS